MDGVGLVFSIMLIISGLIIVLAVGTHIRFNQLENQIRLLKEEKSKWAYKAKVK